MTIIAVIGDATTTTTVAIAAGWPADAEGDILVLEADPAGGSLVGWLDAAPQPSLATIVANAGSSSSSERPHDSVRETIETLSRHSESGLRFVPNAVRARAARRAVEEAALVVVPALAASPTTVLVDAGGHRAGAPPSAVLRAASVIVVVHRQATASAGAAAVRIDRLAETIEELADLRAELVLGVVGRSPFDPEEIASFVDQAVPDAVRHTAAIADDPLAASTIAGRVGVSSKRLRRLPLMRDAAALAATLAVLAAESEDALA